MVEQGTILNITGLNFPVLVLSGNEYNHGTGRAVVCPLAKTDSGSVYSLSVDVPSYSGFTCLDQLKTLDLNARGFTPRGRISLAKQIVITGLVQGMFDYI